MEDKKYYIPEIEEFFIGLKYQINTEGGWIEFIYDEYSNIHTVYKGLNNVSFTIADKIKSNECRIKHLDADDIVGCGWVKESDTYYTLGKYELWFNDGMIMIYFIDPIDGLKFEGTIRNISELKMIMKMVGME